MRNGTKSDLVKCLETEASECQHDKDADAACIIIDGAVLVQIFKPGASKTFLDYSEKVFLPYLSKMLDKGIQLDLVWDQYFERSLKGLTRTERGKGVRRRVLPSVAIPSNWQQILCSSDNKNELFNFLALEAGKIETEGKQLVATIGDKVKCFPSRESCELLSSCSSNGQATVPMMELPDPTEWG